ncbi:germ cell nuclear acidic protein-like [Penaeus indicus]|uniref:germ cell nuclear acidic protein-like n=1 Tax=Penaeus indicus TaxID=29960 RepID=UPI00300CA627
MDPWGSTRDPSSEAGMGFEDSFSPQDKDQQGEGMYIPLDDSLQYIAGLERKLARVQGKTRSQRQAESRRLIDALASSRDAHTQQLMESTDARADADLEADTEHHSSAAVDPQGALGSMLRRVAPNKIALSHEELCRLLEADILAKVHDALEEEEEEEEESAAKESAASQPPDAPPSEAKEPERTEASADAEQDTARQPTPQAAPKEHSSDEGEK